MVNSPVSTGHGTHDVEQIRPGIWSVPVLWPGSPLGYTLAYLLASGDGAVLVDTGWPTDDGWAALVAGVRQTGHEISDIRHVLVTHAHPDHLGMAHRVREISGAKVGMHPAEIELVSRLRVRDAGDRTARWLRARGAPTGEAAEITERIAVDIRRFQDLALPDVAIDDGSLPVPGLGLRAIWTPGHSPGHLCFHDEGRSLLLTGDHVLPRISPHIGLDGDDKDDRGDPLGSYLSSLTALRRYQPDMVLPAHEFRFTRLGARIAALLDHHQSRLAEIEDVVTYEPGLSTWRVAELLNWSRGWARTTGVNRRAAVSETFSHLVHLAAQGRAVNEGQADGVDAWRPDPRVGAVTTTG
jgi:glyoxylase-like metal-dependent hydrolase (beta-lactamase superfamily II)